jgi:hypothetical protein
MHGNENRLISIMASDRHAYEKKPVDLQSIADQPVFQFEAWFF